MTESTAASEESRPTPAKQPSFWEDVIEIFIHPADVYRRRANASVWPPMLFVALAIGIVTFATFNTLEPIFEAEFNRNMVKSMAKNPQITQEMADKMRDTGISIAKYTIPIIILISMFVVGVVTWLVSKLVGAKTTFHQGLVVAAWAYFPRVLGAILGSVQGLLMDPSKLNSQLAISLSPARFMDVDTANPLLYQVLGRFDLITIWVTILLAVGIYVTGGITKQRAVVFGIIVFVVGMLPALRTGYMLM
jgi:hypothetical protein